MLIKTRFPPSPTGLLHVGSVRTALYSWLFARKHQGIFVLRIEDTDHERSSDAAVQTILDGLSWLGLDYDEGPIFQSKRYPRYLELANQLLASNHAYRCTCSKERLEILRNKQLSLKEKPRYDGHCRALNIGSEAENFLIRFKNPSTGSVVFNDEVYGPIEVSNQELDDLVIIRPDGSPTYNFAVVVDDWDMAITHVIRGDDHLSNTPRQILLYQALQAPIPVFAHLPMILGDDGKKLSKRHGAVSVMEFKNLGFLNHALLNYLVRLGWSFGDQEIFSIEEMIESFDLKHISKGVAHFNYDKLNWINQHYLKTDDSSKTANALAWQFTEQGIETHQGPALAEVVTVQADRCKTLLEMVEKSKYFFQDLIEYEDPEQLKTEIKVLASPLLTLYQALEAAPIWAAADLSQILKTVCDNHQIKLGVLAQPLRLIITGSKSSPAIDMTLSLIGKKRVLLRLDAALKLIK